MNQELPIIEGYSPPDLSVLHVLHQGQVDLLLIAAVCGLSLLLMLLWWLAVWEHLRRTNTLLTGRAAV